jgi:hypothetical protein
MGARGYLLRTSHQRRVNNNLHRRAAGLHDRGQPGGHEQGVGGTAGKRGRRGEASLFQVTDLEALKRASG